MNTVQHMTIDTDGRIVATMATGNQWVLVMGCLPPTREAALQFNADATTRNVVALSLQSGRIRRLQAVFPNRRFAMTPYSPKPN